MMKTKRKIPLVTKKDTEGYYYKHTKDSDTHQIEWKKEKKELIITGWVSE